MLLAYALALALSVLARSFPLARTTRMLVWVIALSPPTFPIYDSLTLTHSLSCYVALVFHLSVVVLHPLTNKCVCLCV